MDATFASGGKLLLEPLHDGAQGNGISLQVDGKILIGGTVGSNSPTTSDSKLAAVRLRTDGAIDTSFGSAGVAATGFTDFGLPGQTRGFCIATDASGDILVGGAVSTNGVFLASQFAVARYLPSGIPDSTFAFGGALTDNTLLSVNAIAVQSDGGIVLGGYSYYTALARLLPNGTYDAGFGQRGIVEGFNVLGGSAAGVVVQADGSILVGSADLSRLTSESDLAAFKTVYSPNGGNPANAVGDDLGTDFAATPIPSGPNQGQNWLIIDLGAVYNITDLQITFDGDPFLAKFQIKSGFDSANWPQSTPWMNAVTGPNEVSGLSLTGRYVLVYLSATSVNISGVQVFGALT